MLSLQTIKKPMISTRLLICFLMLSLVPCILLASYTYASSKKQIKATSLFELARVTQSGEQELSDWMTKNKNTLTNLAADKSIIYGSSENILSTIQMASSLMPDAKTLLYAPKDGIAQGSYYGESDISSEDFYKKAMQGNICITSIRPSIQDGEKVFIIAVPVIPINQPTGIIAAEYPISKLSKIIKHAKFGASGFAYIIDSKGSYLANSQQKKIIDPINSKNSKPSLLTLHKKMLADKKGQMTYIDNHKKMTAVYYPVGNFGWVIASVIPEAQLYTNLSGVLLFTIIILFALATIILGISLKITKIISAPLVVLTQTSETLASGDLSVKIPQGSFAEIGRLEQSLTNMVDNTAQVIRTIHYNMHNLTHAVIELKHSSLESTKASYDVAEISEEIASGSEETANTANAISTSAKKTSANMNNVASRLHIIIKSSDDCLETTRSGKTTLLDFSKKIDEAQQSGNLISDMMEKLSTSTAEIKSIAGIIGGISDQTNLLALNAAIEAARAGAHGAGFAVVAEEVRKLSDETRIRTREISEVITGINTAVSNMAGGLGHMLKVIDDQQTIGNKALEEFAAIETSTIAQGKLIREIGEDADRSFSECEHVTTSIQTIAATCQQEAASAQEISAAMQVLREVTYHMDSDICELDALMESLQTAANKFTLIPSISTSVQIQPPEAKKSPSKNYPLEKVQLQQIDVQIDTDQPEFIYRKVC